MTVMNKMFVFVLLSLSLTTMALAGVKVTSVDLSTKDKLGYVSIAFDGRSNDLPDVKVYGNIIEVTMANAESFTSIFKNTRGAQLSANSLNGKAVVKAILPYNIDPKSIDVAYKRTNIEVVFPRGLATAETAVAPVKKTPTVVAKAVIAEELDKIAENKVAKDLLNEDYLNKLMKEDKAPKADFHKVAELNADEIKVKQAAIAKVETKIPEASPKVPKAVMSGNGFSFAGYIVKFMLFLGLVLGLFYGVVRLLKKGIFSRGKLGFLNNTKMIEVLSTTYLSPKRSLMIVKAHNQIFLVANSESGLTFLSEMTDTSGLIKEGEKFVTGTNFDLNLGTAENTEESEMMVKLKENIMESTPFKEDRGLSRIAVAKDIVKFSDELKKKAKKLKPIEFN
jgi:flagellar biogenesis protein FliO